MDILNQGELKAIISLLDDTDPEIFTQIQEKLVTLGKEVIPVLEEAWSSSFDAMLQNRIENIIHKIQLDDLKADLKKWKLHNAHDLLAGVVLIARYQYPDLDEAKIREQLNRIKRDAWSELKNKSSPLEKINMLNRVIFNMYGFNGNTSNFHAPQNSFINMVLESRRGNPLMLSVVYSIIAQQLDMPVYGVNLPEHFILAYKENNIHPQVSYTYPEEGILFYINPFSRGTVFGKKDLEIFLKKLNLKAHKDFLIPCANLDIMLRALRNLAFSYQKLGDTEKLKEIDDLSACISA